MMRAMRWLPQAVVLALVVGLLPAHAQAQVTTRIETDGTLPGTVPVIVTDGGGNGFYEIPESLGWRPNGGTNLFQSFEFFDVGENNTAFFTANSGLPTFNVLARVTGGLPSLIDGRIASQIPNADVWFMNPSGLVFGPGGRLDVPGAFHATTADYLGFAEGSRFYADPALDAVANSVLDVADPPDFGMLGSPLAFGFSSDDPAPLEVDGALLLGAPGRTISLVGGGVRILDGGVEAPAGTIRLISVGSPGQVEAGSNSPDLSSFDRLGEVRIDGFVSTGQRLSGYLGGKVVIRGRRLEVDRGVVWARQFDADPLEVSVDVEVDEDVTLRAGWISVAAVTNNPNTRAGGIRIRAERVDVSDNTFLDALGYAGFGGSIDVEADSIAANRSVIRVSGGDSRVVLRADDIELDDAAIDANGFNNAGPVVELRGGSIRISKGDYLRGFGIPNIDASGSRHGKLVVRGTSLTMDGGQINVDSNFTPAPAPADPVAIDVDVDGDVVLKDFSRIRSDVFGSNDGGDVRVVANNVEVRSGSVIGTRVKSIDRERTGQAGDVFVEGRESVLVSSDGVFQPDPTLIGSRTFNVGGTGSVRVEAPIITVEGAGAGIALDSFPTSTGEMGGLEVIGDQAIFVRSDGAISSNNLGATDAGKIVVQAPLLVVEGDSSTIQATAAQLQDQDGNRVGGTGDAGTIEIDVGRLELLAGGQILTVVADGAPGDAGDTTIRATDSILIDGQGVSDTQVSSTSTGTGDAGSVELRAPQIEIVQADIRARAINGGRGGDLTVVADGDLKLQSATITAANEGPEDAGRVLLQGESVYLVDSAVETNALGASGGGIEIRVETLLDLLRSHISSDVAGGNGGSVRIEAPTVVALRDGSFVSARARELGGTGGRIDIAADAVFVEHPLGLPPYTREPVPGDSFLSASAPGGPEAQGEVNLRSPVNAVEGQVTPLNMAFLDAVSRLSPSCAARASEGDTGSFAVARHRGLPANSDDLLIAYDEIPSLSAADPTQTAATSDPASTPPALAGVQLAQASLSTGAGAFRGGDFVRAAEEQSRAAELLAGEGDVTARVDSVRALAQSQLALGRYAEAAASLEQASAQIDASLDPARAAALEGSLGNAYLAMGDGERAEQHLERGSELAAESGDTGLAARLANNLGNLRSARGSFPAAIEAYERSAGLAAEASSPLAEAKALSNGARAALESGEITRAGAFLTRARASADALPQGYDRANVSIHLARSYERLATAAPAQRQLALLAASTELNSAAATARKLDEPRTLSRALGELGHLYEGEARSQEALLLTRSALREANTARAPELVYRWYWQEARLLWAEGNATAALRSYRRAFEILEETRQETLAQYGSAEVRFRRAVAPVYRDFAAALLESSDLALQPEDAQQFLIEARAVMERFKAAELRDYFRDECVAEVEARAVDLDRVSRASGAAVVYPVVLPDRLELLLSLPSGIERRTVPVPAAELQQALVAYRTAVSDRGDYEFLAPAQQLFDWLVRPYLEQLESEQVSTLVFVPDGALRTVPLAALHDGEQFLVQRYAVAITPGLSLVDPQPFDPANARLLLAGLSEATQGFPELPNAGRELEAIQALYGGEVLLNEDFGAERFEGELATAQPNVVHVASHAVFTGDSSESFLLTHDGRLSMSALADAIAPTQFRQRPVELLTLSACETAVGDERAALGLAGVALRAGARSALGSLWRIQDEATYLLVLAFYEELAKPGVSKAEALRRAQETLMADLRFAHPYYWSSFLLISNWL